MTSSSFHVGRAAECRAGCCVSRNLITPESLVTTRQELFADIGERRTLRVVRHQSATIPKTRRSPVKIIREKAQKRARSCSYDPTDESQHRQMMMVKRGRCQAPTGYPTYSSPGVMESIGSAGAPVTDEPELVEIMDKRTQIITEDMEAMKRLSMVSSTMRCLMTVEKELTPKESEDETSNEYAAQDLSLDGDAERSDMRGDADGNPSALRYIDADGTLVIQDFIRDRASDCGDN